MRFHGKEDWDAIVDFQQRSYPVAMLSMNPESFGLVGIEATAFGRPIVAFDSGGISDWLADGETGLLVERGDVRVLSESIARLLGDETPVKRMGNSAKRRLERYYRLEQHLPRLHSLYEAVIRGRKRQRVR